MRMKIFLWGSGVLLSLLISASISLGAEELTGEQIKEALSGKTVEGASGSGVLFTKFYNADGNYTLTFMEDMRNLTGRWFVIDDKYCQTHKNREKCYIVEKDAAEYKMIDKGNGSVRTIFQIKP